MHADAAIEAQEIFHRGRVVDAAGRDFINADIDVVIDHLSRGFVFKNAIRAGVVIFVLLGNLVIARRSIVSFLTGGNARDADEFSTFVEKGFLLAAIDFDHGGSGDIVAIPVGYVIRNGWCGTCAVGRILQRPQTREIIAARIRCLLVLKAGIEEQGNDEEEKSLHGDFGNTLALVRKLVK